MVLPWYIEVQRRNPTFYRFFFLEHNLERFATNRYQHHQPFWFYAAVLVLGLMPWVALSGRALVDAVQVSVAEWKVRHNPQRYLGHSRAGDAFPEFLVLWALFPIVFFSFSGSKLPGYILPSIPPLTILTGDYLNRIRREGLPPMAAVVACGSLRNPGIRSGAGTAAHEVRDTWFHRSLWLLFARPRDSSLSPCIMVIVRRWGISQVLTATLIPVLGALIFLLGFHGKELDLNYSARPLAAEIARDAPDVATVATEQVRRDMDYGLAFYRNRATVTTTRTAYRHGSTSWSSGRAIRVTSTAGSRAASISHCFCSRRRVWRYIAWQPNS